VGGILKLVGRKSGKTTETRVRHLQPRPAHLRTALNEIVLGFLRPPQVHLPRLRLADYQPAGEWESPMVKLDILVSGEPVDALSVIVHKDYSL